MNIDKNLFKGPLFFEKNRVRRIYMGGKLFSGFFGDDSTDGICPEEWVCSSVPALNDTSFDEKIENEGISTVKGTDILFSDLATEYQRELFGDNKDMGILVKMLDSAIRLPVQSHPDKAFARVNFGSEYGKAESWVILGVRDNACIYYGFKEQVTKEEFRRAVHESETNPEAMVPLLNRIPVKVGDVFLIGAKTVHAIGAGCLILETQEPTDFTVQPEYMCGDYKLNEQVMFLGLDEDTALDCFDYTTWGDEVIRRGRQTPEVVSDSGAVKEEILVSYDATPCFSVRRVTLKEAEFDKIPPSIVCVITDGEGVVTAENGEYNVKKGSYFFVPAAAAKNMKISGSLEAVFCLPPQK